VGEVSEAAQIVGKNYSTKYEIQSKVELRAMFNGAPFRPIYFVAERRCRIVGFAGCVVSWMDYGAYEILWVNVMPKYQGEGIGQALVAHTLAYIKEQDRAKFALLTARGSLVSFYRSKFGFKSMGRKGDEHLMRLIL